MAAEPPKLILSVDPIRSLPSFIHVLCTCVGNMHNLYRVSVPFPALVHLQASSFGVGKLPPVILGPWTKSFALAYSPTLNLPPLPFSSLRSPNLAIFCPLCRSRTFSFATSAPSIYLLTFALFRFQPARAIEKGNDRNGVSFTE